jgi:homoprotocatechuate degradation regulator HpaR
MALMKAREAVMSRFRPILRRHNLTEQQWRVMRAILAEDDIEATTLAERCYILMPSLTRILQNLESRTLIERRSAPHDQRRTLISITPSGRQLIDTIAPQSEQAYHQIEESFGLDKLEELYGLLREMTDSLGSDTADPEQKN